MLRALLTGVNRAYPFAKGMLHVKSCCKSKCKCNGGFES